ncbi:restriction endonuclease fold toxin-2 domain-containing protein [Streptomyces sp. NPDC048462]|uniref:restriction endonuclease fold toxin-2 domain-containing protein n=1 Tax=Streptomyces sp. NPDC048462 TaxID=3365555 RepID=UPI00371E3159
MSGGLAPQLKVVAEGMIQASMGLATDVMEGVRDTAIGLFHELDRQKGMAGDDEAGQDFERVYVSAASTTLNQMGFSAYVLGETGRGLMRTAREYMAQEENVAAIMGKQVDLTSGMGDPGANCIENYLNLGEDLPEVIGESSWFAEHTPGRQGQKFRGDPGRIRDVAGTWRHAGQLMMRFLTDAQTFASTADRAHEGVAADAFRQYFNGFVGRTCPPQYAQEDEPLVANLVAACTQLATACDQYADHVEAALKTILQHQADLFRIEAPWDSPMFGGNGDDGGLQNLVLEDPWIRRLGTVAQAVDTSEARVKLPHGSDTPPGGGLPFLPLPIPLPVPVAIASFTGMPGLLPMSSGYDPTLNRDPLPPTPGTTQLLSSGNQAAFRTWAGSLPPGGFGGGGGPTSPDNAYQMRVSGYPEREVPLPAGASGRSGKGLMIDGMRPVDGYAVEAKHVREPGCRKTFRSLDSLDTTLGTPPKVDARGAVKFDPRRDGMFVGDEKEMSRYKAALSDPRNHEIRGFEIATNDPDAAPYWQSMMAMTGVQGTARYVP